MRSPAARAWHSLEHLTLQRSHIVGANDSARNLVSKAGARKDRQVLLAAGGAVSRQPVGSEPALARECGRRLEIRIGSFPAKGRKRCIDDFACDPLGGKPVADAA